MPDFSIRVKEITDIKGEPRTRSTNKNFEVVPSRKVQPEVIRGGLLSFGSLADCVGIHHKFASSQNVRNVVTSLLDVTLDIHGETRSFMDG